MDPAPHTRTHAHTVWRSHAHATAVKADPSYPAFAQTRAALAIATKPLFEAHVPFSGNPQRVLEAPATELDFYRTGDPAVDRPEQQAPRRPAAETQELVRRITCRVESLQMQGFVALSWGVALEDGRRGVYLGGWRSIEVRFPLPPTISRSFKVECCHFVWQDHMRLGTLDEHKVFVEETEEIFKSLTDLYITYVHFKSHSVPSSA